MLGAGVFWLALGASSSLAADFDCVPVIERTIDELGLDRADISHRQIFTRSTGRFSRWPQMEVWIWFKSCRGNVVIDVQPRADCRIRQVYSMGDCALPARP